MIDLLFAVAFAYMRAPVTPARTVSAIGTWKLNVARSSFTPGPGWRSQIRTYSLEPGGGVLIRWTGVGAHREPMQVSFVSRLDGKDYTMTGSANYDTINAVPVNAFTVKSEEKRGGKVVGVAIIDRGTNRKGQTFSQVLVFDRQR